MRLFLSGLLLSFSFSCFSNSFLDSLVQAYHEKNYEKAIYYFYKGNIKIMNTDLKAQLIIANVFYEEGHVSYPFYYYQTALNREQLSKKENKLITKRIDILSVKAIEISSCIIKSDSFKSKQKSDSAIYYIKKVISIDRNVPEFFNKLVSAECAFNIDDSAFVHHLISLKMNPFQIDESEKLMDYYTQNGKYDFVYKIINAIKSEYPHEASRYRYNTKLKEEKYVDALSILIELYPDSNQVEYITRKAQLLTDGGKKNEAINYLEEKSKKEKGIELKKQLASTYYESEDYEQAQKYYSLLCEKESENPVWYYKTGLSIRKKYGGWTHNKPEMEVAAQYFEKAIALDSTHAWYYYYASVSNHNWMQLERALPQIDKAIQMDSLNFDFYLEKWSNLRTNNDRNNEIRAMGRQAVAAFAKAFNQDPTNAYYAYGLGKSYWIATWGLNKAYEKPERKLELKYLEKALELDSINYDYSSELATEYCCAGDNSKHKARQLSLYQMQLRLFPEEAEVYYHLYRFYKEEGQYQKSNQFYVQLVQKFPEHWRTQQAIEAVTDRYNRKKYNWTPVSEIKKN